MQKWNTKLGTNTYLHTDFEGLSHRLSKSNINIIIHLDVVLVPDVTEACIFKEILSELFKMPHGLDLMIILLAP